MLVRPSNNQYEAEEEMGGLRRYAKASVEQSLHPKKNVFCVRWGFEGLAQWEMLEGNKIRIFT